MQEREAWLNCLFCFINFPLLGYGFQSGEVGSNWCLSGGFVGTAHPFMPHRWPFTRPMCFVEEMKMDSASMAGSKRRISSNRGLGGVLREQRARLYIIRRCVIMLLYRVGNKECGEAMEDLQLVSTGKGDTEHQQLSHGKKQNAMLLWSNLCVVGLCFHPTFTCALLYTILPPRARGYHH
ncbi:hypothetical protein VNO78_09538 [Psophocarpus tetragonolobus]|uniref:Uncharacterized protein n=1 Tax=Psophocarpus tetragonolobus TaxID=3891 RepID=A0AAN9SZE7_PSOTE